MIQCQPGDCDNCKYADCIGIIKQKPGRKKLPDEERRRRRNERSKKYYQAHQAELQEYGREYYRRKKNS